MDSTYKNHTKYMQLAIVEALKAYQKNEVPVGAVLVSETGRIIAAAHNLTICRNDPTSHAEISAIRQATQKIKNYRLLDTTIYTTIEPCIMCMGAIVHARIKRVVFGTPDPKWGAAGSLYDFSSDSCLNHVVEIIPDVCRDECRAIIQQFFQKRRKQVATR